MTPNLGRPCSFPAHNGSLLYGSIERETSTKYVIRRTVAPRGFRRKPKVYYYTILKGEVTLYERQEKTTTT